MVVERGVDWRRQQQMKKQTDKKENPVFSLSVVGVVIH